MTVEVDVDRNTAALIVESILSLSCDLNQLTLLSNKIENESEKKQFRKNLAEVMTQLHVEILLPIFKDYPDLDPDK